MKNGKTCGRKRPKPRSGPLQQLPPHQANGARPVLSPEQCEPGHPSVIVNVGAIHPAYPAHSHLFCEPFSWWHWDLLGRLACASSRGTSRFIGPESIETRHEPYKNYIIYKPSLQRKHRMPASLYVKWLSRKTQDVRPKRLSLSVERRQSRSGCKTRFLARRERLQGQLSKEMQGAMTLMAGPWRTC